MTSEALLKLEMNEAQKEIQRLKDRLATVPPTVHKDSSLISLVPGWSGTESAVSLEKCLSSIGGSARIGHWLKTYCLQVTVLGFVDNVRTFFQFMSRTPWGKCIVAKFRNNVYRKVEDRTPRL